MTRKYLIDLAERVAATYVETFLGLLIAAWGDIAGLGALSVVQTAGVAAVPAALAVAKGGLARAYGDRNDPSLVAPPLRTTLGDRAQTIPLVPVLLVVIIVILLIALF